MKKHVHLLTVAALWLMVIAAACSGKKDSHEHDDGHTHDHDHEIAQEEWKEMDDFHSVMADAFHPYKDSQDLAPAKAKAGELADAAATWAKSDPPKENKDIAEKLQQLKAATASFVETVKGGDDKIIAEDLTTLHDQFHEIQELWYGHSH